MDDFLDWLDSPDGQLSEAAILEVQEALEEATVDPKVRKIIWKDGSALSIEQTAQRIKTHSRLPLNRIQRFIVIWLEQDYCPEGLSTREMDAFEKQIDKWIAPYDP